MAISYSISYTFSPSTTIASSQVNQNFSDNSNTWNGIEAKTKSFSNLLVDTQLKSGGTVETGNGTAGAPSFTFGADTATGFFRSSSTVIGVGTSNKITGVAVATAATDVPAYSQLKVIQIISSTTVTAFTTTSSAFQTTNCTASITPTSASNKVLILAFGNVLHTSASTTACRVTLAKGTSNLCDVNGMFTVGGGPAFNAGALDICGALGFIDSPATTSATTYNVRIRNEDNATSVGFGRANHTQVMILMEVV